MSALSLFAAKGRFGLLRTGLVAGCALALASLFATSCMTPEFDFGDGPIDADGLGGAGSGGSASGGGGNLAGHCENRRKDADETDTDCGGLDCDPCSMGRTCSAHSDCENDSCVAGKCQAASCTDGEKNDGESDTDCGGDSCAPCPDGDRCAGDDDCESKVCSGSVCQEATCDDGVKNGKEVGVDCAGDCPEKCDVGQQCGRLEDCLQPPEESGVDAQCVSNVCVLNCPMGQADCNSSAADLCEINTSTSLDHCGDCNQKCDPEAAVASCSGGICGYEMCLENHEDVDGNRENGCEVDNLTDPMHCGAESIECSSNNGTPSCSGGECAIECDEGYDDCNGDVSDGCEIDLNADVKNCNGCGDTCPSGGPNESPYCLDGSCGLTTCDSGLGDCDGDQVCTDDLTSNASCGSCGTKCTVSNGTPGCNGSSCEVASCNQSETNNYADCDDKYVTGCEVDILNSKFRCGGCLSSDPNAGSGQNCESAVGTQHIAAVQCGSGSCQITGCESGWADCDGSFANGCEIDLNNDDVRCGGCLASDPKPASGTDCTKEWANANGSCDGTGQCQFDGCKTSFGDCENGINADGCETDLRSSEDHCGSCNAGCETDSVTSSNTCTNKVCVPTCQDAGIDCDGNGWNGCENTDTSEAHCGACNNACNTDSVTNSNQCMGGDCVPECQGAGMSCDGVGENGCEDTDSDAQYCGACGISCSTSASAHVTSNACSGGACQPQCSGSYRDCDGEPWDGCETNTASGNVDHCGGCNMACGTTGTTATSCSSSKCVPTCAAGRCVGTTPELGCVDTVGSTDHCLACNDKCDGASNPFCSPEGCRQRFNVTVVNSGTIGSGTANPETFSHSLATGSGNQRMVLVAVAAGDVASGATYDGKVMSVAGSVNVYSGEIVVYYLLDADLPSSPGSYNVAVTTGWAGMTANVVELRNVDQTNPLEDSKTASDDVDCDSSPGPTVTATPTVNSPGTLLFAAAQSAGNGVTASTIVGGLTQTTNLYGGTQAHGLMGYRQNVSSATSIGWKDLGGSCWDSGLVALSVNPYMPLDP